MDGEYGLGDEWGGKEKRRVKGGSAWTKISMLGGFAPEIVYL